MNHTRWRLLPPISNNHPVTASGFSPLVTQLLYNRGLSEPSQVEQFINADERLLGDPLQLPDMHLAVARIYQALLSGENIAIYGDFDVDGITATAVLVEGLSILSGKITPYIPNRLTEGYGLKTDALKNLHRQGISLVITVDCGITAVSEVRKARRMGLDVIITDHHTPSEELPPAVAAIDPKLPHSTYPFPELAGVGVALKLLQALFKGIGKEKQLDAMADLVALGTVADMTPLLGENRYFVQKGLKLMNKKPRLGIKEILARAGLNSGLLDSRTIAWTIAPRLNAAGRLAHAFTSYELLTTDSVPRAQELSLWLEQKNAERRKLTDRALTKARDQVLAEGISPLLVASDHDYPPGIAGLVASRLAEEFYRPAIVIRIGNTSSGGSCRSIPEFNIIAALRQCHNLLTRYGGHSQAAGLTLPTRNFPQLKQQLTQIATTQLAGVDLRPSLDIDVEVSLPELGGDAFDTLQQLAPFGSGNPVPTFLSRQLEVTEYRTMGNNGEHLRLKLRQGDTVWDAVGFGLGNYLAEASSPIDVVYNLEVDQWNGKDRLRLNILDFTATNQPEV